MTPSFLTRPTHDCEIEMMLQALTSVIDGCSAVYLSAPITSGRPSDGHTDHYNGLDLSHWESSQEHLREIVEANRSRARSFAQELRLVFARVVIDPTAVAELPGWTQEDYRHLWARVIERYVDTVVFINGWQYSSGCTHEFLTAQRSGATTVDETRRVLRLEEGIQLIQAAIMEMRAQSLSTAFLEKVVEALVKLHSDTMGEICAE